MAIDVMIKQRLFGGKTMPLEVILGDELCYGNFVNDQLNAGELGESEFVAYHPEHIGRGFSVVWNPGEKKRIDLRLPMPSTEQEIADFYAAVERMAAYWDGKLVVDGSKVSLPGFLAGLADMVEFNEKTIRHLAQQIMDGELDTLTLYSAMWPLAMDKNEAEKCMADSGHYARWLHEKQTVNARYAVAEYYQNENGISGRYTFKNGLSQIFLQNPRVPFGMTDLSTGKELECAAWSVLLGVDGEAEALGELEYNEFLKRIPEDKILKYDGDKVQVLEMNKDEIRKMFAD